MSNVTFFNQKRHSMSSHGIIKSDIACWIVHVQTKEKHSQNTFFYLHCIVEISLELTVKKKILQQDNSTCYVWFNYTMRRHWMTFLVEKCNIGHFCTTDIFYAVFLFLVKIKSHCNIMIYDKKDVFQSFYLFFHYQIRYFSYAWISILNVKTD
jgi:hypothetical protein